MLCQKCVYKKIRWQNYSHNIDVTILMDDGSGTSEKERNEGIAV